MGFSFSLLFSFLLLCSFLLQSSHAIKRARSHSHGPNPSASDLESATNSHYKFLASHLGSHEKAKEAIFYSYNEHINGFAAVLEEVEALEIAKNPNVVSVFLNKGHKLQTTRSWESLGLEIDGAVPKDSLWEKASYGEGVIIGVWPESKSFSDEGMDPVPSRWQGGNFVPEANVFGYGNGTSKGGSPRAYVAAYKVCCLGTIKIECTDADIMEAFEAAISDGVDVISCSLGHSTPTEFFEDGISIGLSMQFPMIYVGASTIDRDFANYIALGDKKHIMGASLSTGLPSEKFYSLISSIDAKAANATIEDAQLCKVGTLDPKKAKGKILVRLLKELDGLSYAEEDALSTGTVGLILSNSKQRGNDIVPFAHLMPTSHINYTDGEYVYSYKEHAKSPVAYMTKAKTLLGVKPAPPDITAPGLDILSAGSEAFSPTGFALDTRRIYIISAMTLDKNNKPIMDQSKEEATPFAYGAGHIQPELAMDPGLVPDLGKHSIEITRTVTNVGPPDTYEVHVKAPIGVSVLVEPRSMTFIEVGEKKNFKVFLKGPKASKHASGYVFGSCCGQMENRIKSPLVVKH
ncbi:hypothetical protein Fmac_014084 [Flemingia macrophylla]|uniref:Uncharacterized protein n=1 Tax=Flemingia macrophylla TaxID=520843 RepID=A0ABD1MAR5_9FABA